MMEDLPVDLLEDFEELVVLRLAECTLDALCEFDVVVHRHHSWLAISSRWHRRGQPPCSQ